MADIFSKQKRSEIMSKICSKDTKAELLLRKALYSEGLRYVIHDKRVFGKLDIIFFKKKVTVFVDGDWWHGRNFKEENDKYSDFRREKIARNIVRDQKVDKELVSLGWTILKFWQKDIEKRKDNNVVKIIESIKSFL